MEGLTPICPYCGKFSQKTTGKEIYPHRKDLHKLVFYSCSPCKAYIGCHASTGKPFGTLADARLRSKRSLAHKEFDVLWKEKHMTRKQAYSWLASKMGISANECHIGLFDTGDCEVVIQLANEKLVDFWCEAGSS